MPPRMVKKKHTNWFDVKNREELFFRYFQWRMSVFDLDHSQYCQILTKNMSDHQKCWFSFLFGMTYRTPQAYAYCTTFPSIDNVDIEELEEWHKDNWKRTTYGTDARYNKGHFHTQVKSIIAWKGKYSLLGKVKSLLKYDDTYQNFESLFEGISQIYKYGRMTSWLTCQCLYDTLNLPIDFNNVLIRSPNSDSSMQSIWNGYCMLKGRDDMLVGKQYGKNGGYTVTPDDLVYVSNEIMKYRGKACAYANCSVDVFKWESIWCQYKRLFHEEQSKEYPGHSSGDATSRYEYYRDNWPEIDWLPFREALLSHPGIIKGQTYVREYNAVFGNTGLLLNMHEMFDDMPNAYEELGLDPNTNLVHSLFKDHGLKVPCL